MIENKNDRALARHMLNANNLNAAKINAHCESENGNNNSASHGGYVWTGEILPEV